MIQLYKVDDTNLIVSNTSIIKFKSDMQSNIDITD